MRRAQVLFWLGSLATFVLLFWYLQEILLPFVAGFVLAYFLDPVADRLEAWGLSRLVATSLIVVAAILALVFGLLTVLPILSEQLFRFAGDLPELVKALAVRVNEAIPQNVRDILARSGTDVSGSVGDIAGKATGWIASLFSSVWSGGMALVNTASLLIVTPIVAFYLLLDWDGIVAKIDSWVPREHLEEVRAIARDIDKALAGFIRGQGTVCLLLGVFYAGALSLVGLKFGLAIGLIAGALSFIPFVGAIIGGVTAIGVALVQFLPESYTSVALVAGIFAAGQIVEGNVLSPKLVGSSVGLHPVWLMFSLLAFGYVFGFAGLLLAVPLAAACGVLVRFALKNYLRSALYDGVADPEPARRVRKAK